MIVSFNLLAIKMHTHSFVYALSPMYAVLMSRKFEEASAMKDGHVLYLYNDVKTLKIITIHNQQY